MIVHDSPAAFPRGRAVACLGAVAALGVGLPVALAVARHAWSVPTFDDYAYARDAYTLHETGTFSLHGWGEMSRVGMLVAVQPFLWVFGNTLGAVHAFGASCLVLLVLATYDLVSGLAGRARGLGAAALTAFCPQVPALVPSFMTDVPMLAFAAVSAAAGARALRTGRNGWLAVSLLVGFLAFSTREVGAAAPAAVLAAEMARRRLTAVVLGLAFAATALALELWRHTLPGDQAPGAPPGLLSPFVPVGWTTVTLGLLLAPVVVGLLLARNLPLRLAPVVLPLLALVVVDLVLSADDRRLPLPGADTLDPRGAGTDSSIAGHPPSALLWVLVALQVPAALGGLALLLGLRRPRRGARPDVLMTRFLLVGVLLASLPVLSTHWLDRYCLPLAWAGAVVLLGSGPRWPRRAVVAAGFVAATTFAAGLATADEGFRVHAAEWSVGDRLVEQGYDPLEVDAGLEWVGYHNLQAADLRIYGSTPGASGYAGAYGNHPCVTLALQPAAVAGRPVLATYPWSDTFGGHHLVSVVAVRDCPVPDGG